MGKSTLQKLFLPDSGIYICYYDLSLANVEQFIFLKCFKVSEKDNFKRGKWKWDVK